MLDGVGCEERLRYLSLGLGDAAGDVMLLVDFFYFTTLGDVLPSLAFAQICKNLTGYHMIA